MIPRSPGALVGALHCAAISAAVSAAEFFPTSAAELVADIASATGNGEHDTITLPAGVFTLSAALEFIFDAQTITIRGDGMNSTFIEAGPLPAELGGSGFHDRRVLHLNSGSKVVLEDLTIRHGNRTDEAAGNIYLSNSALTMRRCAVLDSFASASIFCEGGGIRAINGTLHLEDCRISGNEIDVSDPIASTYGARVSASGNIDFRAVRCEFSNNQNYSAGTTATGRGECRVRLQ